MSKPGMKNEYFNIDSNSVPKLNLPISETMSPFEWNLIRYGAYLGLKNKKKYFFNEKEEENTEISVDECPSVRLNKPYP